MPDRTAGWIERVRAARLRRATGGALLGYLVAAASVAAVTTGIGLLATAPRPSVSMLYLVAVLATATRFGRGPAIAAAGLAVLAFNFFFVEPVHTLVVNNPDEWFSLLLLLLTAIVAGTLGAEQRRRADEAASHEREALVLHALTELVYSEDEPRQALPRVAARLLREVAAEQVVVLATEGDGPTELARAGPADPTPGARVTCEHLRARDRQLGLLRVVRPAAAPELTAPERRILSAAASQIGLALERSRLRAAATESEVLRKSDDLKSALLRSVSHDLRTPLASIKAAAGSLVEGEVAWSADEARSVASRIEGEVDRLNRIIGNLLDISRIEAGALHPRKELFPLVDLASDVVARLAGALAGHRVVVEVPEDLPPVPLDYVQIEQVLTNLVENARIHTPPGSEIRLSAEREGDALRVTVADDGPGIPPPALGRVFDTFFRATGARPKGSGLGLAVAKGLVEAHHGRIWVESEPGKGTAFHFMLPLTP